LITVGVVSPILAIRAGLRALLETSGPIEVIWETHNLVGIEELPEEIDVLLVASPTSELHELERLLASIPGLLAVLVLTSDPPSEHSLAKLPVRAWGILGEDSRAEELLAAIQALHLGLLVGDPTLARPALARLLFAESDAAGPLVESLTERELEVLQWLAQGLANKQIASQLGISEHTVKFHVSSIYSKLDATNRAEAVRLGVQQGLILL
jgi:two-component system, NarL family, response regulator YdfI